MHSTIHIQLVTTAFIHQLLNTYAKGFNYSTRNILLTADKTIKRLLNEVIIHYNKKGLREKGKYMYD